MHSKVESYVRTALDASPHGIAVISIKEPGKGDDVIVAWYDQDKNLKFSTKLPEISPATLANKTVEVIPLDFTLKFGPHRADAVAESLVARLETGPNAGNTSNEGVLRAIEGVDNEFGVDIKPFLQKGWQEGSQGGKLRQAWDIFKQACPAEAEVVAKLLLERVLGVDPSSEEGRGMLTVIMGNAGGANVEAFAINRMSPLIERLPEIILPKTFLEGALRSLWADLREAYPLVAETLAKTFFEVPPELVASEISSFMDKMATSATVWATQNSRYVYNSEKGEVWFTGNQGVSPSDGGKQNVSPSDDVTSDEPLMGRRAEIKDIRDMIKAAVDASPTKVAIIAVKGGSGFGSVDHLNTDTFDHVLVAYYDEITEDYVIAEMTPNQQDRQSYFGGRNDPGTLETISTQWDRYVAVSLKLTPEQDLLFKVALNQYMGDRYSFIAQQGNSCAALVMKALMDAGVWDWKAPALPMVEKILQALAKAGFNTTHPGTLVAWATGKGGQVFDSETFVVAPDLKAAFEKAAFEMFDPLALLAFSLAFSSDAIAASSHEDRASGQAGTDDEEGALPSRHVATASDDEDARGDDAAQQAEADAAQQPETDDDEKASQKDVALASDNEDARDDDDASQQPETDDDEDASQEQVALASDPEDARPEDAAQQPETDDDEDASQEQVAIASDSKDAPSDDAAVLETASAQAVADSTLDDQAGPQLATSAPDTLDGGFSYAAFAKQGVTVEAAKAAMPVEQLSPEGSSGSGTPESESAHPDIGSEDVGNAAPTKEPVAHHGDLAP